MARLEGKTALITAAGQGIGRATAELFIKEGANVIATDINKDLLSTLKGAKIQVLDVTDQQAIKSLAKQVNKIDILFNCAGYVHPGTILECREKDFDFSYEINVKSMYRMIKAFLPAMLSSETNSSIINMSSVASTIIAAKNRFVYGTTKAAVIGLTKAVAADYVKENIRCNAIAPGTVESPSLQNRMKTMGNYEEAKKEFLARQPTGKIGTAEEIANLVLYLASDESSYTTGAVYTIDGGWSNT